MKKKAILFLGIVCAFSMSAQNNTKTNEHTPQTATQQKSGKSSIITKAKTAAPIWTEDFAGGIPADWVLYGHNGDPATAVANATWEYRGPSTIPSSGTGSRGAWAGTAGVAGGAPIASPTAANGFMIFDSDFLDNNGVQGAAGTGVAPTPHVGELTTDTLDLSGFPNIQLTIHSSARYFAGRYLVAFSSDGGATWGDTIRVFGDLAVNASTPTDDEVTVINVSNYIGNSSMGMIRFIFDGSYNEPGANGQGYYYWMIDDLSIDELPDHAFAFTPFNGAPANDIIFGGDGANAKTGNMILDQVSSVEFDSNILNFGVQAQTNVSLEVDVYRDGNLETTLASTPVPILAPGDTADFSSVFTPSYTPTAPGRFDCVFRVVSDSVPAAAGSFSPLDTAYSFWVSDPAIDTANNPFAGQSLDFRTFSNSMGTDRLGTDGAAMAVRLAFPNANDVDQNGDPVVKVNWMDIRFSTLTIDGGDIQLECYAATGFDFVNGFGAAPIFSIPYTLNGASGNTVRFNVTNNNGFSPELIPDSAYFFVVHMFSNAGNNTIRIANDQAVSQPGQSSIMYNADDARWYTGYSGGSRTFSSPHIRVGASFNSFSINENPTFNLSVYPNPSNGENVNLQINESGSYTVELVNTVGAVISSEEINVNGNERHEMNFASLARGIYILNVKGESGVKSTKLTIK
tara:strand:+ start:35501 stop:37552 length:2052 start_codon:yes stop_codon:yes gene_type:complete